MGYGFIVLILIVLAVVGGFAVLASAVVRNWRARSRGKKTDDAVKSKRTIEYERCYNECMAAENWDPDKEEMCKSRCEILADQVSSDAVEPEKSAP
jgi:hypothetical protein